MDHAHAEMRGPPLGERIQEGLVECVHVVGMNDAAPAGAQHLLGLDREEILVAPVREDDLAVRIGHPHQGRRSVGRIAEPGLAVPELGLETHPPGRLRAGAEQAGDSAALVPDR